MNYRKLNRSLSRDHKYLTHHFLWNKPLEVYSLLRYPALTEQSPNSARMCPRCRCWTTHIAVWQKVKKMWNVFAYMIIADIAFSIKNYTKNRHDNIIHNTKTHPINWSFTRGEDDFYKSLVYDLQPVNLQKIWYMTSRVKVYSHFCCKKQLVNTIDVV